MTTGRVHSRQPLPNCSLSASPPRSATVLSLPSRVILRPLREHKRMNVQRLRYIRVWISGRNANLTV